MWRKSHVRFGKGPTEKRFGQRKELAGRPPYYVTEMDPVTGLCFGLVEGFELELGYFDLTGLAETTVFGGVPAVERHLYWEPRTQDPGPDQERAPGGLPARREMMKGESTVGESGADMHFPDVVKVEEFLLEHRADAAPDEVGERRHVDLRSRTDRGIWRPGTEARISVKALYDLPGGDRVTSTAVEMTCVAPSAPNSAPTVSRAIADATIVNESDTEDISLGGVFSDADGDDLNISASSSAESVATVSVSADHSTLTVTARARGTATVRVAATDRYGGTVSDSFSVKVKAAPVVASAIADANRALYGSRQIDLSRVFSDADGDTLTYTVSSTDEDVVAVYEFHGAMTVVAIAEGEETVTVTAQDSDGNRVIHTFEVTVAQEQKEEPQKKKEESQQQAQGSEQPPDQNPPEQGQPKDPQSSGQPGQEQPLNQKPAGSTGSTGSTGSDRAAGRVTAAYQQPQADAGPDCAVPAGRVATLDGSCSSGPQGTSNGQLSWFWSQASGPQGDPDGRQKSQAQLHRAGRAGEDPLLLADGADPGWLAAQRPGNPGGDRSRAGSRPDGAGLGDPGGTARGGLAL